ncbi:carcinoembryonic antigen-related cell adhesion molecule 6-like [Dendropsophus ebraccatus]|uniref:carcinoembryonic antigen-related cell adhesion molecule 6-like n=1 Tax=Dendropsophus ebraccatus TaxID=150705 RepID=UPI003831832A
MDSPYRILSYFPGSSSSPIVPGPLHNPRITAFNNGSLQIKDLLITDGGNYMVKVQTATQEDAIVTLTVYEPVTKPKITASITQPKENETLTLTCDTSNAVTTRWSRRGTSISSEARLSTDNRTLTFSSIKREDAGQYQCEAQNIASKDSSDPYTVTVTYGPDNMNINGNIDTAYVRPGSSITLTCSADSSPPPEYLWRHNGTVLEGKTKDYAISAAMYKDEGTYMCTVKNLVTLRIATVSVYLNVTEVPEFIDPPEPSIGVILGVVSAIIIGAILSIGSVCLYRKCVAKRKSESSENRQDNIPVYENMKAAQSQEESSYMGLQSRSEDTYTELKI